MVALGAWSWTQRALAALAAHTRTDHEVVLVDNASSDDTAARVHERFPGVRVIENPVNEGFGRASNQGAAAAHAPLVCFLNTDALVDPGWLGPLVDALSRPDVGAAVPCILELDGRVQCAGALLGRDGTVLEHGNGAAPGDAAVAFPRSVDFGPAACMIVDRSAFVAAGGFDDTYSPAYYEDADLCLALARRGLRTVYIPAARVRHARYGSGTGASARALSETNRARFAERWHETLAGRPATLHPPSAARVLAARDAMADGRVLVFADAGTLAERPLVEAVLAVLSARPWARVTLVTERCAGHEWLERGVEVLQGSPAAVVAERRFHYDAVLGAKLTPATRDAVATHQPQAIVAAPFPPPAEMPATLASAGLAPA